MRRLLRATALVGLVAGVVACGDASPAPGRAATTAPAGTATPAPTPTPTSTEFDGVDLAAAAIERAVLRRGEANGNAARPAEFTGVFVLPCAVVPTASQWAARGWTYGGDDEFIGHGVAAYHPSGSSVLQDARLSLRECRTWTSAAGDLRFTAAGEVAVPRPTGADDAFAYCYRLDYLSGPVKGDRIVVCQGVVSRGYLVAGVGVFADTVGQAQQKLRRVVPFAAAAPAARPAGGLRRQRCSMTSTAQVPGSSAS